MQLRSIILFVTLLLANRMLAQEKCVSAAYQQEEIRNNSSITERIEAIEAFTSQYKPVQNRIAGRVEDNIIKIPVVVHVLYHLASEKITEVQVAAQIAALNKYFRRRNSDTMNTPAYFRQLAADVEIEFQLAVSDPKRRSTSGVVYKYTPITVMLI